MEDNDGVLNILESWLNGLYCQLTGCVMTGQLSTTMSWSNLTDYPVACPAGTSITQLDDSVTCTAFARENTNVTFNNMTLDGYLRVGTDKRDIFGFLTAIGDAVFGNRVIIESGLHSYAPAYGVGIMSHEYSSSLNITSMGGTATLTAATQYICDTTDPFSEGNKGMILTVIDSTPSYTDATGEIKTYVNSSCIEISFGSAGSDTIIGATGMSYYVYPHPVFMALDNGYISNLVGENPDAKYEIHIPNGTGFTGVYIDDVAGADQHQVLTIDMDIKDYDGVVGLNLFGKSSTGGDSISSNFILMESKAEGLNNSDLTYISLDTVGSGGNNNELDGIRMSPFIDHLIHVGSADTVSSVYDNEVNITGEVTDGGTAEVFTADNDVLYVGSTVNFTHISFALDTEGSANALFLYWYCNGTDYKVLTVGSDTTNGFSTSGGINFQNPSDRGTCNFELDDTPFTDANNYSYIALQRTRNNLVTPPILDTVTVAGATESMILQKDMMRLNPIDTAPETCSATILGAIYFDISEDDMCVCKSGGWKVMTDGSACT